jgi:hypothetical protein
MKKIIVLLLLVLPTSLTAQWSIIPSVGVGNSRMENDRYSYYYTDAKLGYDVSVATRYSLGLFFASVGVGYQDFKSSDYLSSLLVEENGQHLSDYKYSNIYLPISVGFHYNKLRLYPIAEVGINIMIPTKLDISRGGISVDSNSKSIAFAYLGEFGAGYKLTSKLGAEIKFSYTKLEDIGNSVVPISAYLDPDTNSWIMVYKEDDIKCRFISVQASLVIKL